MNRKKIKDLTKKDILKICKFYRGNKNCSENCILNRLSPNRPRICSNMFFNKEEREYMEQEIDLDNYEIPLQNR